LYQFGNTRFQQSEKGRRQFQTVKIPKCT